MSTSLNTINDCRFSDIFENSVYIARKQYSTRKYCNDDDLEPIQGLFCSMFKCKTKSRTNNDNSLTTIIVTNKVENRLLKFTKWKHYSDDEESYANVIFYDKSEDPSAECCVLVIKGFDYKRLFEIAKDWLYNGYENRARFINVKVPSFMIKASSEVEPISTKENSPYIMRESERGYTFENRLPDSIQVSKSLYYLDPETGSCSKTAAPSESFGLYVDIDRTTCLFDFQKQQLFQASRAERDLFKVRPTIKVYKETLDKIVEIASKIASEILS